MSATIRTTSAPRADRDGSLVAIAAPQLSGVPLVYPQFRSTIGLEIYGG